MISVSQSEKLLGGVVSKNLRWDERIMHDSNILLHSALYIVSFYKALWTSSYTSQGIGWGNPLAGECVTIFSYLLTFLFIVTAELLKRVTHSPARGFPQPIARDV